MGNLDSKRYKTAATLYWISGIILIIVGVVSSKFFFLPIGIALVVLGMAFYYVAGKPTNDEQKDSSE
jgi:hypothetical protein